eukprot:3025026-Rhodomonas_salina.2
MQRERRRRGANRGWKGWAGRRRARVCEGARNGRGDEGGDGAEGMSEGLEATWIGKRPLKVVELPLHFVERGLQHTRAAVNACCMFRIALRHAHAALGSPMRPQEGRGVKGEGSQNSDGEGR